MPKYLIYQFRQLKVNVSPSMRVFY